MLSNKNAKYFLDLLAKLPRGENSQSAVLNFLINFASERGLEFFCDNCSNILITKIKDESNSVAFCVDCDLTTSFARKSIFRVQNNYLRVVKRGDYLFAKGGCLKAEAIASIALVLELLDCDQVDNFEVLFVAQGHNELLGARGFDCRKLKSKMIISLVADKNNAIKKSCLWATNNIIKFKNDKEFIKNSWQLKTFRLTIDGLMIDNQNISVKILSDLTKKIPNARVNKMFCGKSEDIFDKHELIFTTDISEREIKNIVKEMYIQTKKISPKFFLKCTRQINQTLVMCDEDMLTFASQFEQGKVGEVIQTITSASTASGFLYFDIMAKDYKTIKNQFDELRTKQKQNDTECVMLDVIQGFETDTNSMLLKSLTAVDRPFALPVEDYNQTNFIGIFADKIKKVDMVALSFEVENKGTLDEKIRYSSFVNMSIYLKNFLQRDALKSQNNIE